MSIINDYNQYQNYYLILVTSFSTNLMTNTMNHTLWLPLYIRAPTSSESVLFWTWTMIVLKLYHAIITSLLAKAIAYHHCSSITRGALLTEGTLHQLQIPVQPTILRNYLHKWKSTLNIQYHLDTTIANGTTVFIPTQTKHLHSARDFCKSMDSTPCSVPITKDIIKKDGIKYYTKYRVAYNKNNIFCIFDKLDITQNDNCIYQLQILKDDYKLKGLKAELDNIKKILKNDMEGVLTITKLGKDYYLGLSVITRGVILPCCTTSPKQSRAEILLQSHFTEKIKMSENKLNKIENYMVKQSNRNKRSIWSFFGIASESEIVTINNNLLNNYESLKSQGLAISKVSNSQKKITQLLNQESSILNIITRKEKNLEVTILNLTETINSAMMNTSYQLNTITKSTNFILLLLDLSDKLSQIEKHLDTLIDYTNCANYCPDNLLDYDRNEYVGHPSSITIDSDHYNLILRYTLYKRSITVFHLKCIPYMYQGKYRKIEIPEIIALGNQSYLDISKDTCTYKGNFITCGNLFHKLWRKNHFDCIQAITNGTFSPSCVGLTKTYDKPDQDILMVDHSTTEIFTADEDMISVKCKNYSHNFSLSKGTNFINGTCNIETSHFHFSLAIASTGIISHRVKNYLNYSIFDRLLHFEEDRSYNTSKLDILLTNEIEEEKFTNWPHINDTVFTSVSILQPLQPMFVKPGEYWYYWVIIGLTILGLSITLVLSCYYRLWCSIITKCFRKTTFSYEPAPKFHCSNEHLELLACPETAQYYTWELENHPGYKILLLKNEGTVMGMFDRKWVNTLPNFDSAKIPHIPKNVIDQLTPNLECKITLNCNSQRIEISEFDYHYSEVNGPGWYNNMTKLPSYAFPMPNYRLRAKLMALARKGASQTP